MSGLFDTLFSNSGVEMGLGGWGTGLNRGALTARACRRSVPRHVAARAATGPRYLSRRLCGVRCPGVIPSLAARLTRVRRSVPDYGRVRGEAVAVAPIAGRRRRLLLRRTRQ